MSGTRGHFAGPTTRADMMGACWHRPPLPPCCVRTRPSLTFAHAGPFGGRRGPGFPTRDVRGAMTTPGPRPWALPPRPTCCTDVVALEPDARHAGLRVLFFFPPSIGTKLGTDMSPSFRVYRERTRFNSIRSGRAAEGDQSAEPAMLGGWFAVYVATSLGAGAVSAAGAAADITVFRIGTGRHGPGEPTFRSAAGRGFSISKPRPARAPAPTAVVGGVGPRLICHWWPPSGWSPTLPALPPAGMQRAFVQSDVAYWGLQRQAVS